MFAKFASIVAAAAVVFLTSSLHAETIFYGPTPYLSAADSPFDLSGLGTTFWLEDFEDGALNTPGVSTRSGYYVTEPEFATDSVDADDGMIDGLGSSGRSFFATGVACTGFSCVVSAVFDFTATNGQYPTAVGVVL